VTETGLRWRPSRTATARSARSPGSRFYPAFSRATLIQLGREGTGNVAAGRQEPAGAASTNVPVAYRRPHCWLSVTGPRRLPPGGLTRRRAAREGGGGQSRVRSADWALVRCRRPGADSRTGLGPTTHRARKDQARTRLAVPLARITGAAGPRSRWCKRVASGQQRGQIASWACFAPGLRSVVPHCGVVADRRRASSRTPASVDRPNAWGEGRGTPSTLPTSRRVGFATIPTCWTNRTSVPATRRRRDRHRSPVPAPRT